MWKSCLPKDFNDQSWHFYTSVGSISPMAQPAFLSSLQAFMFLWISYCCTNQEKVVSQEVLPSPAGCVKQISPPSLSPTPLFFFFIPGTVNLHSKILRYLVNRRRWWWWYGGGGVRETSPQLVAVRSLLERCVVTQGCPGATALCECRQRMNIISSMPLPK